MGIQASFKVFRQLLLLLDFGFNIQALEWLVTSEAVNAAIAKVEEEVVVGQEGVANKGPTSEEEVAEGATIEGNSDVGNADTEAVEMPEGEDAS